MPLVLNPISTSQYDLATSAFVTNVLAAGGFTPTAAQTLMIPTMITAASKLFSRYCGGRLFGQQNYAEILTPWGARPDRGEVSKAALSQYPITGPIRLAMSRTSILIITNTDQLTNQDAWVIFNKTGDVEYKDLIYTGVTLTRMVSGTVTQNQINWTTTSPYTTITDVANSINALGGGWQATVQTVAGVYPNPGLLPAAWMVGIREPKLAFGPGVSVDVYSQSLTWYDIDIESGILKIYGCGYGSPGLTGWSSGGDWTDDGTDWGFGFGGYGQVQAIYQAGYNPIPEPLQLACAEQVQYVFNRLNTDQNIKMEKAKDYQYETAMNKYGIPEYIMNTLDYFKDWKI